MYPNYIYISAFKRCFKFKYFLQLLFYIWKFNFPSFFISSLAEEKAKKRISKIVENKDIVEAFIEGTRGPFQADMKEGLKKYGLLNE